MPYQKCKAEPPNFLTPTGVLATLAVGLLSHDPSGRDFKEHFQCALI
jgi:hypothetical protein